MITVKASQKFFTYAEVTNLTGFVRSIWKILQSVTGWASLHEPRRLRATTPTIGSSDRGT
jgi:hypothetical protein